MINRQNQLNKNKIFKFHLLFKQKNKISNKKVQAKTKKMHKNL